MNITTRRFNLIPRLVIALGYLWRGGIIYRHAEGRLRMESLMIDGMKIECEITPWFNGMLRIGEIAHPNSYAHAPHGYD